jgi:mono/diheme cytochrome c family protein
MKKLIVLSFICAAGAISCGKKIMPESDANNPSNEKSAKSGTQSATTTPSFNNMQKSVPPPADGPRSVNMEQGKTVFVTKCASCHALKNPGDYTVDQMNTILQAEIPKAKLSSKEAEQVTAYLLANTKK